MPNNNVKSTNIEISKPNQDTSATKNNVDASKTNMEANTAKTVKKNNDKLEINNKLDLILNKFEEKKNKPAINAELVKLLETNFNKIDEALLDFKKSSEQKISDQEQLKLANDRLLNSENVHDTMTNNKRQRDLGIELDDASSKLKKKNSYAKVTDQMFQNLKEKFPHINDNDREYYYVGENGEYALKSRTGHRFNPVNNVTTIRISKKKNK